jgi:hypothetical protein
MEAPAGGNGTPQSVDLLKKAHADADVALKELGSRRKPTLA